MATDMTEGRIAPQLIRFTIPLVLGNLFQLTYNAADSIIAGKFIGDGALAAVGTSGSVLNLVLLFISGLCIGASVLMSEQFGAKDYDKLSREISTTMLSGFLFTLAISALLYIFTPQVLRLIQVQQAVFADAVTYLRIVAVGLVFTFIYNFLSNTLRALGDSRTALYFLIAGAVINVFGDLFFIVVLHWGVAGSAIATDASQALSCVCCAVYIRRRVPLLCLGRKWRVLDRSLLARTFSFGIITALQQMSVQLGKVFVQSFINTMGVSAMAAYAAVTRVDDFAITPQQNISHAMTTFISQNRGAEKNGRIRQGFACGIRTEFIYTAVLLPLVFFGAPLIMRLFVKSDSAETIAIGAKYLRIIACLYFMPALTNALQGFFRGTGDMKVTLASSIANIGTRAVAAYFLLIRGGQPFPVLAWACGIGWVAMLLFETPQLLHSLREYPAPRLPRAEK